MTTEVLSLLLRQTGSSEQGFRKRTEGKKNQSSQNQKFFTVLFWLTEYKKSFIRAENQDRELWKRKKLRVFSTRAPLSLENVFNVRLTFEVFPASEIYGALG